MFDVLDGVGFGHVGRIARHHLFQEPGAAPNLFGEANEIVKEVF
jgi:hypothetical protein